MKNEKTQPTFTHQVREHMETWSNAHQRVVACQLKLAETKRHIRWWEKEQRAAKAELRKGKTALRQLRQLSAAGTLAVAEGTLEAVRKANRDASRQVQKNTAVLRGYWRKWSQDVTDVYRAKIDRDRIEEELMVQISAMKIGLVATKNRRTAATL